MKREIYKTIKLIIFALIFMTIGSLITIFVKKASPLTLSKELDIPDLLSIVVTIILALYIGFILEKNKDNERNAKDTIIEYYKEYDKFLRDKVNDILKNNSGHLNITSNFKLIRIKLYELKKIAVSKKILTDNDSLLQQISTEVTELWRICTGDKPISHRKTIENIELSLMRIDVIIYKIILEINEK